MEDEDDAYDDRDGDEQDDEDDADEDDEGKWGERRARITAGILESSKGSLAARCGLSSGFRTHLWEVTQRASRLTGDEGFSMFQMIGKINDLQCRYAFARARLPWAILDRLGRLLDRLGPSWTDV